MSAWFERWVELSSIGAVIVTGAGAAFTAGFDLEKEIAVEGLSGFDLQKNKRWKDIVRLITVEIMHVF